MRTVGPDEIILLLKGLQWTIALSAMGFVGGIAGGLMVALARTSPYRVLRIVAARLIDLFQGTPLLMQLFVIYFGVALLNFQINAWAAVALGLTLHASAFLGEIWRGCIEAVPRGQSEAARALGLHYVSRMRLVVLPQAFRISLPSTVGFLVQLIKGTSLSGIVGFTELARTGQIVANATFQPLLVYSIVGLFYFALCWPLSLLSMRLEKNFAAVK